jgi:hypothetical protein
MFRLWVSILIGVVTAGTSQAAPKVRPPLRGQCIDGTMANFIAAESVALAVLTEKLPRISYEGDSVGYRDNAARGKLEWEPLPKGATAALEMIGEYQAQRIYRVVYEWDEDGGHCKGIVLAISDPVERANARPFFAAGDEQLSNVEATVASTNDSSFSVEAIINWKGNGVMWSNFFYLFDKQGPYLFQHRSGGRGSNATTEQYKGNSVHKKWTDSTN